MNRIRTIGLVLASLFIMTHAGQSHSAALRCDSCSSQDMAEMAMYSGDGFHQVYDIQGERLEYFNVSGWGWQPIAYPAPSGVAISTQSVPVEQQLAFGRIAAVLKSLQVSGDHAEFHFNDLGVGYVGATAVEAVESITLADAMFQRLMDPGWNSRNTTLSNFVQLMSDTLAQALIAQLNLGSAFEIRVRVLFADGSSVIFQLRAYDGEIVRAETAEGQIIPTGSFSSGTWIGANLDSLGAYLERRFASHVERVGDNDCPIQAITMIRCETHRETGMHCTYTISCY